MKKSEIFKNKYFERVQDFEENNKSKISKITKKKSDIWKLKQIKFYYYYYFLFSVLFHVFPAEKILIRKFFIVQFIFSLLSFFLYFFIFLNFFLIFLLFLSLFGIFLNLFVGDLLCWIWGRPTILEKIFWHLKLF